MTASGVAGLGGVAAIWNVADGSLDPPVPGPPRPPLRRRALARRQDAGHLRLRQDDPSSGTPTTGKPLRTLDRPQRGRLRRGLQPRRPLPGERQRRRHLQGLARRRRPADGYAPPAAQGGILPAPSAPTAASIVAGGADNTIRVWEFVSRDKPRINPMVLARFAHEGPDRPAGVHARRLAARLDSPRTGPSRSGRPPTTPSCSSGSEQPDVATAPGRRGRRHVVPRRPDGRVAGDATPSRPRDRSEAAGPAEPRRTTVPAPDDGRAEPRRPSANRTTPRAGDRRGRPGGDHRDHRRRRSAGGADADLYPLLGQGRRAVGDRGQRGPLRVEARLVRRGARRPGASHPAGAAPGGARTPTSRSAARTTARPTISASSTGRRCTSTSISMPMARS